MCAIFINYIGLIFPFFKVFFLLLSFSFLATNGIFFIDLFNVFTTNAFFFNAHYLKIHF
jgi:hypothetical protein